MTFGYVQNKRHALIRTRSAFGNQLVLTPPSSATGITSAQVIGAAIGVQTTLTLNALGTGFMVSDNQLLVPMQLVFTANPSTAAYTMIVQGYDQFGVFQRDTGSASGASAENRSVGTGWSAITSIVVSPTNATAADGASTVSVGWTAPGGATAAKIPLPYRPRRTGDIPSYVMPIGPAAANLISSTAATFTTANPQVIAAGTTLVTSDPNGGGTTANVNTNALLTGTNLLDAGTAFLTGPTSITAGSGVISGGVFSSLASGTLKVLTAGQTDIEKAMIGFSWGCTIQPTTPMMFIVPTPKFSVLEAQY